jgi:RHS repeat-associated protein
MEVVGGTLSRAYVQAGLNLVALLSNDGQFYWIHTDHLSGAHKLTNTSGTAAYHAEYDPHGQMLLETGITTLNSRKFTGYERDAMGQDYANARMYAGSRGRFTQPDPVGIAGAKPGKPESFNRYAYVGNDPVNARDPQGTWACYLIGYYKAESWTSYEYRCYADPWDQVEPIRPEDPPDTGGGVALPPTESELLLDRLEHLPQACIDAFGGQEKIDAWKQSIRNGEVRFFAHTSNELIRNSPLKETVSQYWARKNLGDPVGHTVWYNDWGGGYRDSRTYGTIILGPGYYDPSDETKGAFPIYAMNNGNATLTQQNILLHEFLHWETNGGHSVIVDKDHLNLERKGYDISNPARALNEFLANDCKTRQPGSTRKR